MKKTVFRGVATALITPTDSTGVDYNRLAALIEWQIAQGVDALVICGTTGESSTMTDAEHKRVIDYSITQVAGRVPVIAGTGSNETAYALELTRFAARAGADAALVVTPYYNKATQNGLYRMFTQIADCSDLPVILYNVPSRTGVNIEPETYSRLADHDNIVGYKEANGNISKIVQTAALVGDRMTMYSGNDDQIVPLMSVGAQGVISVFSNICPRAAGDICRRFFEGDVAGSAALQLRYLDLINALFCEVNPIPVKAAMAAMGFCEDFLRLPLTQLEDAHRERLFALMRREELI